MKKPRYANLDVNMFDHPRIQALLDARGGAEALLYWQRSLLWSVKHLTDGYLPANWMRVHHVPAKVVRLLQEHEYWIVLQPIPELGSQDQGWLIRNYAEWQVTEEQWTEEARRRQERARKGGLAKAEKRRLRAVGEAG